MIILRDKLFSKKPEKDTPKKTRIGIGWLQENMGKNEAEEIFRDINEQIDSDYAEGKSREEIIKNAEKAGKRSVIKRNLGGVAGRALIKGIPTAVIAYAASKNSKLRDQLLENRGINLNGQKESSVLNTLDKHKGKIAVGAGLIASGIELSKKKNLPSLIKKTKSAKNAGERTAEQRTKNKKEDKDLRQKEFGKITGKFKDYFARKSEEIAPEDKKLYDKILKDNYKEVGVDKIGITQNRDSYIMGQKTILLGKDTVNKGKFGYLAHEMGHAYHDSNKKSKLGRAFHRLDEKIGNIYNGIGTIAVASSPNVRKKYKDYDFSNDLPGELKSKINRVAKGTKRIVGSSVSGISGIAAGYKAEEEKEKGNKKKARLISAGSLAIPILGHTPELGSEISASSKAMKMIKAAGANKKQINTARKSLGYALGTYGVDLGKNLIINGGSQLIGKGAYKLTHRKKKEDKKGENLDKNPTMNLEKNGLEVR